MRKGQPDRGAKTEGGEEIMDDQAGYAEDRQNGDRHPAQPREPEQVADQQGFLQNGRDSLGGRHRGALVGDGQGKLVGESRCRVRRSPHAVAVKTRAFHRLDRRPSCDRTRHLGYQWMIADEEEPPGCQGPGLTVISGRWRSVERPRPFTATAWRSLAIIVKRETAGKNGRGNRRAPERFSFCSVLSGSLQRDHPRRHSS